MVLLLLTFMDTISSIEVLVASQLKQTDGGLVLHLDVQESLAVGAYSEKVIMTAGGHQMGLRPVSISI